MIYGDDEHGYTISSGRMWLPGIYATQRAARAAFKFDDATLQRLTDAVCKQAGGRITSDDLRAARSPETS